MLYRLDDMRLSQDNGSAITITTIDGNVLAFYFDQYKIYVNCEALTSDYNLAFEPLQTNIQDYLGNPGFL